MKALICLECHDIVAPYRQDGRWRLCQCGTAAVSWRDGSQGLLDVSSMRGRHRLRVLGLNNSFLMPALQDGEPTTPSAWRSLHESSMKMVGPHYLFHENNRACWACVVAIGETGDVQFINWDRATALRLAGATDRKVEFVERDPQRTIGQSLLEAS